MCIAGPSSIINLFLAPRGAPRAPRPEARIPAGGNLINPGLGSRFRLFKIEWNGWGSGSTERGSFTTLLMLIIYIICLVIMLSARSVLDVSLVAVWWASSFNLVLGGDNTWFPGGRAGFHFAFPNRVCCHQAF